MVNLERVELIRMALDRHDDDDKALDLAVKLLKLGGYHDPEASGDITVTIDRSLDRVFVYDDPDGPVTEGPDGGEDSDKRVRSSTGGASVSKTEGEGSSPSAPATEPKKLSKREEVRRERLCLLPGLVAEGKTNEEIRKVFGCAPVTISELRKELKLDGVRGSKRASRTGPDKSTALRRFTDHKPLNPEAVWSLDDDHPAITESRTLFPTTVVNPLESPRLLVSGHNSPKTGRMVTKGPWKGMPIFTLTLQERATCSDTCHHWRNCYGNAMPQARRHAHGIELENLLPGELRKLNEKHPDGFVVRLHVLGDFYSEDYVRLWAGWIDEFKALHVFGYTAWDRSSEIGAAIRSLSFVAWDRFAIRFSSKDPKPQGATSIDRVPESARVPEGIVCPAETGKTECCGTCGLCWHPTAREETIVFVLHGPTGGPRGKVTATVEPAREPDPEPEIARPAPRGVTRETWPEPEEPPAPRAARPNPFARKPKPEFAVVREARRAEEEEQIAEAVENGVVRRFEPGEMTTLLVKTLTDEGHELKRTGGPGTNRTPWSVDGKKMSMIELMGKANVYRLRDGKEPFTVQQDGAGE